MSEDHSVFGDADFRDAIAGHKLEVVRTTDARKMADGETIAICHGWVARGDAWYICYTYRAVGNEYAFVWETYYDETHRTYSGETAWYDKLTDGLAFKVRYCRADPKLHFPPDENFRLLEDPSLVGVREYPRK